MKRLLLAFATAALALPANAADDEYVKVHTVAIVSTVGNDFILKRIGLMVFGNSESKMPIAQWKIDDLISEKMAQALSPRYQTVPVAFDSAKLAKCWDWQDCVAMLDVVDARTGHEIDHGTARLSDTVSLGEHLAPTMALNPPLLPNGDAQVSDAQLDSLRPNIVDLIDRSYVHALMNANLLPEGADANLATPKLAQ